MMTSPKTDLLKQLDAAREALWRALDTIAPTDPAPLPQRAHDIYAHIAGWEGLVFEAFRAYCYQIPASAYAYVDVDTTNADFVSKRQAWTTEEARRECEINRFAIRAMLAEVSADRLGDMLRFPWGEETIAEFLQGAVDHEQLHTDEVVGLKQSQA